MRSKALAIHDLSCFGKSSLTVVLPILERMGVETAVLPTAVLSTQTDGFDSIISKDLSSLILPCYCKIKEYGYSFNAVYSGYLSNVEQIHDVKSILKREEGALCLIDPVFADSGEIYSTLTAEHVEAMRKLVKSAEIITPNITEASFLLDRSLLEAYSNGELDDLVHALRRLGPERGIVTGVPLITGYIANLAYDEKEYRILSYEDLHATYPGGGDAFASLFLGSLLGGLGFFSAAKYAGDLVFGAIRSAKAENRERRLGISVGRILGDIL